MIAKHFIYTFIISTFFLFFAACGQFESDPCKGVNCGPDKVCFEGECICIYGAGADGSCTPPNLKGSYSVVEDCSNSGGSHYLTFIDFNANKQLIIIKFWELFLAPVVVTYEGSNKLKIARQEVDADNFFVEGEGTVNVDDSGNITIIFNYTVKDESNPLNIKVDSCNNTVYTKL